MWETEKRASVMSTDRQSTSWSIRPALSHAWITCTFETEKNNNKKK